MRESPLTGVEDAPVNTYLEHLLILIANAATSFLETLSKLSATTTLSLTSYYTHSRANLKACFDSF